MKTKQNKNKILNLIYSTSQLIMSSYFHKKKQSVFRSFNRRQKLISTEMQDLRGRKFQEKLSQPQGTSRQDYARNFLNVD